MSILDSFQVIGNVTGVPSVSVTKNGIAFNKAVLEKMRCPEYVCAMIDKASKRIAIVACEKGSNGSRPFYKKGRDMSNGVRWNNADLRMTIENMMSWRLSEKGWKATGTYFEEENALIFDLNDSEPINRS